MRTLRQLRRREDGQTMAEFAIILPMLLLLTFGTIELGVFLQRQLVLTGAGFLAARAATVGGKNGNNPSLAAQEVIRAYAQDSQQPWVGTVVSGSEGSMEVKTEANERLVRVKVTKKEQSLSDLLAAFGGIGRTGAGQLGASIVINREYVQGRGNKSAAQYPANSIVNYPLEIPGVDTYLAGLKQAVDTIQSLPLPADIKGLVGTLTFTPFQAVTDNPGRDERYQVGRTEAAVYAASDLETAPGNEPYLRPSERLVKSLELAPGAMRTLQTASKAAQDPYLKTTLKVMQGAAGAAARTSEGYLLTSMRAIEMSMFTAKGDLP
ncbi:MAG TPA: TadE/TadG family type IV pilus assembly protein [Stenomitos sp.]